MGDPSGAPGGRWAWGLCWLLFASTALSYLDRQAVSVVGERIVAEFGVGYEGLGAILAAFGLTYAVGQIPAGFLADRLDVRYLYAAAVAWWSAAAVAVAWSPSLAALMACRALLGAGEAFNWPCALRVTGLALAPADRGLGNGIFNSGAAVGAVLTPLIVAPLTTLVGWRAAFALVGASGLAWVVGWLLVVNGPARPIFVGTAKRPGSIESRPAARAVRLAFSAVLLGAVGYGVAGAMLRGRPIGIDRTWRAIALLMAGGLAVARLAPVGTLGAGGWEAGLGAVVRRRRFWILLVVSVSINVCWHFLVNWLPTYLKTDRGMPFLSGSLASALPFLAADLGNLGGGAGSRWLARRGIPTSRARLIAMAGSTLLIVPGVLLGSIGGNGPTLALLALMAAGAASFLANYFALCQDVAPGRTGLVVGLLGAAGNLFAAGFAPIAGRIKDQTGGFGPVFVLVSLLPLVGLATLALGWGDEPETVLSDRAA